MKNNSSDRLCVELVNIYPLLSLSVWKQNTAIFIFTLELKTNEKKKKQEDLPPKNRLT